eukprot:6192930-Pleurochrysis_carterae.AAC.3
MVFNRHAHSRYAELETMLHPTCVVVTGGMVGESRGARREQARRRARSVGSSGVGSFNRPDADFHSAPGCD